MIEKNISKSELINYFLNNNGSGYKTKEKHILIKFIGLIDLINNYHDNFFKTNDFPFTQKLYNYLYNIIEIPKCNNCGIHIKWRGIFSEGYLTYCSKQCKNSSKIRIEKAKKTCLKKYGVDSPLKFNIFKKKRSDTILNKYNISNIFEHPDIKEKTKQTNLLKYGKEFAIQSEIIKNKRKDNNFLKYGVENPLSLTINKQKKSKLNKDYFEKKIKQRNYIVLNYLENDIIVIKHPDGHIFETPRHIANNRFNTNAELSTKLLPLGGSISTGEIEIREFLKTLNINYITGNRSILFGNEIDIYLPDNKLGIEFDGLYWHSNLFKDKNYHLNKTEECEQLGIQLLHIFEDEWIYKKEIVKSIIKSKLGIVENKVFARKCVIKKIDNITCSNFLNNNHIQGNINSKVKIGLFYNNDLVSVITFGKKRIAMGNKTNIEGEYEMYRFCNKLNTSVIGGASKLLSYFTKNYKPKSILTFADRRYSQGNLYKQLGFNYIKNTEPNYWYFKKNEIIRYYRFKFRKDVLVKQGFDKNKTEKEIMQENQYNYIYDCGNMKYMLIY